MDKKINNVIGSLMGHEIGEIPFKISIQRLVL